MAIIVNMDELTAIRNASRNALSKMEPSDAAYKEVDTARHIVQCIIDEVESDRLLMKSLVEKGFFTK